MNDLFKLWWDTEGSRVYYDCAEDAARTAFEAGVKFGELIQKQKEVGK